MPEFSVDKCKTEMQQDRFGYRVEFTSAIHSSQLFDFWTNLQDMWLRIYTTKLAVAAAACGHAPAGAIVLLSAADFRQRNSELISNFTEIQ